MFCFPCCFCRRRNKVHPAVVEPETVGETERSSETNTKSPELSQVTGTTVPEISTETTGTSDVVSSAVSTAGKDAEATTMETETTVAETSAATSGPSMGSGEISMAAIPEISPTNTVPEISSSIIIPEISTEPTRTQVTSTNVSEISMVTDNTIVKILTRAEGTRVVSQMELPFTASLDRAAVVQKKRGGSPVCAGQVERLEALAEGAKAPTVTLSPIREQQLMSSGFMNLGNSCYVNASLQCLFQAETFCNQLSDQLGDWIYDPSAQMIRCFTELCWMRQSTDRGMKASLLLELIEAAGSTNPDFTAATQNDAHEFMFHVLGQMQQVGEMMCWTGGGASQCPITAHFGFQLTSIIACGGCGAEKRRAVDFNHLALDLTPQCSVRDCLRLFFSDESEVECRCEVCGSNSASCRWAFHTLPRILVLQLKRFQVSADYKISKQQNKIQLDRDLQLTLPVQRVAALGHTYKEVTPPDHSKPGPPDEDRKSEERQTERNELGDSVFRYSLVSVLNHIGHSSQSGHYVSDCFSQSDLCWLSYDDERVTVMEEERVLKRRQRSAYVLFYERQ